MNASYRIRFGGDWQKLLLLAALLVAGIASAAAATAYDALRVIGEKYGRESLERVVEVQGSNQTWEVSLVDADSPALLQQIRVRNGRVLSKTKRSSAGRPSTPINLDALNLDSDGALTLANQQLPQAADSRRVDYTLLTGPDGTMPVWTLTLRHAPGDDVSVFEISATDGAILTSSVHDRIATADPEPAQEANEPPRKETSTRGKSRVSVSSNIVGKLAGKVQRPVRVVRRFLPF